MEEAQKSPREAGSCDGAGTPNYGNANCAVGGVKSAL
jgi:hypothetical protein